MTLTRLPVAKGLSIELPVSKRRSGAIHGMHRITLLTQSESGLIDNDRIGKGRGTLPRAK
jgi:hypothetical protein